MVKSCLEHALHYVADLKLSVIPIGWNKRPAVKWLEYQERRPSSDQIKSWFSASHSGVAILTGRFNGLVVVDCECRQSAEWFYKTRGKSPVIVKSRRGFHFYFRHPKQHVPNGQKVGLGQFPYSYDVRGDGGYVLAPPSVHKDGRYEWVKELTDVSALPVFDMAWRPLPVQRAPVNEYGVRDAEAYISRIFARAGQGGHNNTFRAACVLKEAGLSEGEALLCMLSWNRTNTDPPWSELELLHKIQSAYS